MKLHKYVKNLRDKERSNYVQIKGRKETESVLERQKCKHKPIKIGIKELLID